MIGAGVALRLRAVQVIQYVEGGTGPERFGFEEEVGFEQEAAPKAEPKAEEVFEKPAVKQSAPKPDNTQDISNIINKWGQS